MNPGSANERTTFWMVWSPQGQSPTAKHFSRHDAVLEAERLARKAAGQQFYVLQAIELRHTDTMQRVSLSEPFDEPPF